jgi:tRNA A37 threonylcarbamoyltransferase TsaD
MAARQVGLSRDELRTVAAQLLAQRAQEIAAEEGISPEEASRKTAFAITEALLEYVVLLIEANNKRLSDEQQV